MKREKSFGFGRPIPLDRNGRYRVIALARCLMHRTEKGKHYGKVTAKAVQVLEVLLWQFHNSGNGRTYPSYDSVAERAGCSRTTVWAALGMLERAGILTWVNRLYRVRTHCPYGSGWRWRVLRTSNSYAFADPMVSSKFNFQTGTTKHNYQERGGREFKPLSQALFRLEGIINRRGI